MGQVRNEVLDVAARLARRANTAWAIAARTMPGTDRLYWSQVAQDYADMAAKLRAAVLIDTADVEWNAQRPGSAGVGITVGGQPARRAILASRRTGGRRHRSRPIFGRLQWPAPGHC
jgi:hypothetical protein